MKDAWDNQSSDGRDVHYSLESFPHDAMWTITAQMKDSVILHQSTINGPVDRPGVEAHFRDDLMKESRSKR